MADAGALAQRLHYLGQAHEIMRKVVTRLVAALQANNKNEVDDARAALRYHDESGERRGSFCQNVSVESSW